MAAVTVALLGGESSGKSTLGLALTHHLNALGVPTTLVPEHLRAWCEREGRVPLAHEQAAIAAEQTRLIDAAANGEARVVVADTTALVVSAYSELVFNDTSLHVTSLAQQGRMHLTLLMGLDFPWQADGLFRDGPAARTGIDALLRRELQAAGISFQTVYGPAEARLQHALRAVGVLLGRPLVADDPLLEAGTGRWSCENCSDPACERRLFSGLVSQRPA
ncbi:ATP-binding protein [Hydrogenophaga sp.]|uniref:ATP-binding protein n=1 Tax=Hydrogenophaga sp. TaxID=1904254 RepID=UPI00273003F1|nr:ATP-binding protein [Hydrogenophaga sp.]MDP2016914.1 ATP-binding protein [Hydrogenophaga sp.]MDP3164129.1 ATP-binding protein [Hydrogenophaga sp.]MDP3809612.1 ATP-binding protein [Hydrogenophaga sp.]